MSNTAADIFLRDLFGDEGIEHHWFYLWTINGDEKRTHWFATPRSVNYGYVGENDVYVGVACAGKKGTPNQRVLREDATAIPGLWADIDWADENHKKQRLPPTQDDALKLILSFPLKPTLIVNSGHGFQCWWLFQEPWVFDGEAERADAALLASRWMESLRVASAKAGYEIDSVHDLSRVMRLPGTFNMKDPQSPKPVYVQYTHNVRYVVDDFEPFLVDIPERTTSKPVTLEGLEHDLNPPLEKFEVLKANNRAFKDLWEHRRPPKSDSSMSGFDLAIANHAVEAGWHDPEVYALLVSHRRKYGYPVKYRGYYERTIARARVEYGAERQLMQESREESNTTIQNLNALLKFNILGFEEYASETPQYRLVLEGGRGVWLGTADTLVNQNRFRTRILEGVGLLMPRIKEGRWETIVNSLMKIRVIRSTGIENTEEGRIEDWLRGYLTTAIPQGGGITDAIISRSSFIHEGSIYIFSRTLQAWIRDTYGERITSQELSAQLEAHGIVAETLYFTNERTGTRSSTNVRKLPNDVYPPAEFVR